MTLLLPKVIPIRFFAVNLSAHNWRNVNEINRQMLGGGKAAIQTNQLKLYPVISHITMSMDEKPHMRVHLLPSLVVACT